VVRAARREPARPRTAARRGAAPHAAPFRRPPRRCNLEGFQESTFFSPSRKPRTSTIDGDGAGAGAGAGEAEVAAASAISSQRAHEELASQVVL